LAGLRTPRRRANGPYGGRILPLGIAELKQARVNLPYPTTFKTGPRSARRSDTPWAM